MLHRSTQRLRKPVGIHTPFHLAQTRLIVALGVEVVLGIEPCEFFHIDLLRGVHQVVRREIGHFDAHVAAVCDIDRTGLRGQRFDHDDAVRGFRAIDRRCRGVFQNGDRCHAVGIEVGHRLHVDLEAVQKQQRLVGIGVVLALQRDQPVARGGASGKRRRAAHAHVGQRIGVRTHLEIVHDTETRFHGTDRLGDIRRGVFLDVLAFDRRYGTRISFLFPGEDTRHDDLFDVGVAFENDLDVSFAAAKFDGDFLFLHADERHVDDDVGTFFEFEPEFSVRIGRDADRGSVKDDRGARNGQPARIGDGSRNCYTRFALLGLRREGGSAQADQQTQQEKSFADLPVILAKKCRVHIKLYLTIK